MSFRRIQQFLCLIRTIKLRAVDSGWSIKRIPIQKLFGKTLRLQKVFPEPVERQAHELTALLVAKILRLCQVER